MFVQYRFFHENTIQVLYVKSLAQDRAPVDFIYDCLIFQWVASAMAVVWRGILHVFQKGNTDW